MTTRYFTLDEAQALLPRVRATLGQALQLHAHLRTRLAALERDGLEISWAVLRAEQPLASEDPSAHRDLARARGIYTTLRERVASLEQLGLELKSVTRGLVDFPSWCDGETEVLLCYRLGEPEITHFHGLDDGFEGRRAVAGHVFTSVPRTRDDERSAPRGHAAQSQ